jgi:hypothetical protein
MHLLVSFYTWCNAMKHIMLTAPSFLMRFLTFVRMAHIFILVALRSKMYVTGSLIAGSNPAEDMDVRLLCSVCVCVCVFVCMCLIACHLVTSATIRRSKPELGCCDTRKMLPLGKNVYQSPKLKIRYSVAHDGINTSQKRHGYSLRISDKFT